MKKHSFFTSILLLILIDAMTLSGCSGKGIGGIFGSSGSGTTVVSGKVSLSAAILSKPGLPSQKLIENTADDLSSGRRAGMDRTRYYQAGGLEKLNGPAQATSLNNADFTVDMYDADHPEWLFPVATGTTSSDGGYTLSTMTNAAKNPGASYIDGDAIPAGNYTVVAYSGFGLGQKPIVAVQSIVKNFSGEITNVDFEVLPSDVAPAVTHMFGAPKNNDGTETWGAFTDTVLPANSAIQLTFSMPMWRANMDTGITIDPPLAGKWSLSADWLTATFYPDPSSTMTPGLDYTITIYGEDSDPNLPRITNVYGNPLKKKATGHFTAGAADNINPTVQWNSPTVVEMGNEVDVTQAFRIESNEMLDVNGVTLKGSPSIGVKPGILFLGRNTRGLYVYEFMLGEPLMLGTSYSIAVSGGKDLSGHPINNVTGSIRTKDATHTPGIDTNAAIDIQNMEAQVKVVFGKWVRAMNDRNLAQWQTAMSGEFYMEYDAATNGIDTQFDLNHDGRYSMGEFSYMLTSSVFPQWEMCGSTITGIISPIAGDFINVVPLTMTADFEFKLAAVNQINMRLCGDAAPKDSFYATVKYKNGGWKIVRASIGVDTRDKTINNPTLISTKLVQSVSPFFPLLNDTEISDGAKLDQVPEPSVLKATFSWEAATGVNSYILIIADERQPYNGVALALDKSVTGINTDQDPMADLGAIDVSAMFGFNAGGAAGSGFQMLKGGRYIWEVIGFGTATAQFDPANPTDPAYIPNKKITDLIRDITATSKLRRFGIAGVYRELTAEVRAGTSPTTAPTKYSTALTGYDLGGAYQATITIYTPNQQTVTGNIRNIAAVYKSTYKPVPFSIVNGLNQATTTVTLYQGLNTISFYEDAAPGSSNEPALSMSFNIWTNSGLPPAITVWEVVDDHGKTLTGDIYGYFNASSTSTTPGASKISIKGAVSDMSLSSISIRVMNEFGPNYRVASLSTSSDTGDNIFSTSTMTVPDLEIYKGLNNILLSGYNALNGTYYRTWLSVRTDVGSVWVPPIAISDITAPGASTIAKTAEYSTSSDWSATLDASANYTVAINGKFKTAGDGRYYLSSDGGYGNGALVSSATGSFNLNVLLYDGWNYLSLYDSLNNYYYVQIKAEGGKVVIKPVITTIDGNGYDGKASGNAYASTRCTAQIVGTAEPGQMDVYWQSYDGKDYYYESSQIQNTNGSFSFSVPLVSGSGSYNMVNINDAQYRYTSVRVTTSGMCPYVAPLITLTEVRDAANALLPESSPGSKYYDGTSTSAVSLKGTSNRPGGMITGSVQACNQEERYSVITPSSGTWSISNMKVYAGYNYLYLQSPNFWESLTVNSTTTATPTLRMNVSNIFVAGTNTPISLTQSACGNSTWNAGSATVVDIVGTTTVQNGTMQYTDALNRNYPVTITNGSFKITNVAVYNTANNTVSINNWNDPAGTSSHYMTIAAANSNPKPQYIKIVSPSNNQQSVTGLTAISGTVTDPVGSGFNPTVVNAYVYGSNSGSSVYYSNDPYYQSSYGYLPLTYANGTFSLDYDFGSPAAYGYIEVYAWDNVSGQNHYDRLSINSTGTEEYAKPGMTKAGSDPGSLLHTVFLRQFLADMNR